MLFRSYVMGCVFAPSLGTVSSVCIGIAITSCNYQYSLHLARERMHAFIQHVILLFIYGILFLVTYFVIVLVFRVNDPL